MACVTDRTPQRRRVREHYFIRRRVRCGRIGAPAPRVHDTTDRYVVSAGLEAVTHDNLTGKRECSRDRETTVDEEDTLPYSTIDREVAGSVDHRCSIRAG